MMEKLPHETERMFERRKKVYEKATNAKETQEDAVKLANIWANIEYFGCTYNQELTQKAKFYGQSV